MKSNRFFYLVGQGLKGVVSHGFRAFATVTIIVACLVIMGSFSLLAMNVDGIIEDLEEESEILAFVDETYTEEEARAVEPALLTVANVREVKFISRAEAMENYMSGYSSTELFEDIDSSVFRDRFVVYLDDITLMDNTRDELKTVEGIADVNAYIELAEGFVTVRNVVSAVTMVLIIILLVVSMFIISNTIKLATYTRRQEIAIMKMVGAGDAFIRMPFVVEGLALGILGALIAFFLEWFVYNLVTTRVMTGLAGSLFSMIPFARVLTPLLVCYLGVGIVVGALGGTMAIRNYLKV